jgi:NAD(P)H-hydrate epimerase
MREIDRLTTERNGIPSSALMENAAAATARAVAERTWGGVAGKSILVLCGSGNNGGDGAATARLLALAGAKVDVVLLGRIEDTRGDARTNLENVKNPVSGASVKFFECRSDDEWKALRVNELEDSEAKPYTVVVDALFGTGLTRPLGGVHREAVRYLRQLRELGDEGNPSGAAVISIDIPSGLNSDSAQPIGEAVHADVTVTMTAPKPANVLPPASGYNGKLVIADIGSPVEIIQEAKSRLFVTEAGDARRWLIQTRYTPDSYKNTHGHVLVIAGSRGFTGAAALCGNAAMRSGAGLVTVATPVSAQPLVAAQVMPEVMTASLAETDRGAVSDVAMDYVLKLTERADVVAIGPGLSSEDERTRNFVRAVVEQRETPIVIDADGLNCLAPWLAALRGSGDCPLILTPHPGEMLRLMGADDRAVLDDRVTAAREFAVAHEVILVLKGTRPLIAAPDGRVFVNPTGNAGLGTAGAGDTLTGIIAGFLAQAYATLRSDADALETIIAALYIGGLAGDLAAQEIGMRTMVASDIREHLSAAIFTLDPEGEVPT